MLTESRWTEAEHAALCNHDPLKGWIYLAAELGRTPQKCWERYRVLSRYRARHGRWPTLEQVRVAPRASSFAPWTVEESDRLYDAAGELDTLTHVEIARLLLPTFPGRTVEAVRQRLVFLDPLNRRNDE